MADALVKHDPFLPANITDAEKLATTLAKSALLPEALRNKPGDVLVTIITGHELGLSPMQAIRGMHVVKGRAIMSADLAVSLVKRHPECLYFRLVESNDKIATYETHRKGNPSPTRLSYTIAQAQQAGLTGNDNYRKHPAAMLRARCSMALGRVEYPDIMLGVYDPDEIPEAAPKPERTVAPPPPKSLQVVRDTPEDAEIVEPPPPSDADFSPPADEPMNPETGELSEPSPREKACILISEAPSLKALTDLTPKILELGVAKDAIVRELYARRQAELKKAGAA